MLRALAAAVALLGLDGRWPPAVSGAPEPTDVPYQQPQQIHIGLGASPGEMSVHWTTMQAEGRSGAPAYSPGDSFVLWGPSPGALDRASEGYAFIFRDRGPERRNYTMHIATMAGLTPSVSHWYVVGGNRSGWSSPHRFVGAPVTDAEVRARLPMVYAIYGDQGDYNGQTLPSLQAAARRRELDMVLHVGDMAYDLDSDNGRNGDAWMRDIEPLAAAVPYMVSPGNHESGSNFNHYSQRFRNMPSNSGNLSFQEFGSIPNNWWFSWDSGLVHFVAVSTEVYFDYHDLVPQQYRWLERDLQAVNRSRTPWVIAHGHRPLYCSCDSDCDDPATTNRMGLKQSDGSFKYGLEQLFYEHGVDLYVAGHEHDYERMFDVAPHYNATVPWLSGTTTRSTKDPPATTHIVTGSAGNVEDHESFTRPAPSRSAKRLNTYGWSRMAVHNATHLLWQQVQTDSGQPSSTWGEVMDETWIVQRHHGPFTGHPRRGLLARGVRGLAEGSASIDVDVLAARPPSNSRGRAECRRVGHGDPVCGDPGAAAAMRSLGRWQFTRVHSEQREQAGAEGVSFV